MPLERLIEQIVAGGLFFAKTPSGQYVARYTRSGPVYVWTEHGLQVSPLQGSDLCWHLRAESENEAH